LTAARARPINYRRSAARQQAVDPANNRLLTRAALRQLLKGGRQMTFLDRINEDLKAAMKSKDSERLSTLRMAKTALKNREIDKMSALTDEEAIKVLQSLVKQRRDSIEQYQQAGRIDLAEKEAAEIKVIEEYLPAALDEAAVARVVEEAIAETGAGSIKEMGVVMKAVMAKLAGQNVDGKAVNQIVKTKLGG
jgi:uncharacterized protein YqeY